VGTTLQLLPFQCSASVLALVRPTAQTSVAEMATTAFSLLKVGSGLGLLTIDQPALGLGVGDGVGVGVGVGVGDGFGWAWDATTPVGRDAAIVRIAATTTKTPTRWTLMRLRLPVRPDRCDNNASLS
jgi:hypothetical protein